MKKTVFALLLTGLLFSCSRSNEPVLVYNTYDSFDTFQKAYVHAQKDTYANKAFNPANYSEFNDFSVSYYLYGLCADRLIHHDFTDICSSISAFDGLVFFLGKTTSVFLTLACNTVVTYASVHQNESVDSSVLTNAWRNVSELAPDGYYPPEMKNFAYDGKSDLSDFTSRFFSIVNGDGAEIANILFPKGTDLGISAQYVTFISGIFKSFEGKTPA